jgi:hypothetical protein
VRGKSRREITSCQSSPLFDPEVQCQSVNCAGVFSFRTFKFC